MEKGKKKKKSRELESSSLMKTRISLFQRAEFSQGVSLKLSCPSKTYWVPVVTR